jgi:DNA-binding MarR family transcriptional regulator
MIPDDAGAGGVWVTCADLARRRGVSRAAITKRVNKLVADGLIAVREDGASRLVDVVSFDRAIGETGDAIKEQAAATRKAAAGGAAGKPGAAMRDAQTERAQYEARMKALDLAERERQVLPIKGPHGIEAAAIRIATVLARDLDGMAARADEVATAVSREGVAGARRVLKEIAFRMRQSLAASLAEIAADGEAAEREGPIEADLE